MQFLGNEHVIFFLKSLERHLGEKSSGNIWKRHLGDAWGEASGEISGEVSGERDLGRHLEGIWETSGRHLGGPGRHLGGIWEASRKHLGSIWEASEKHLGDIWEAIGKTYLAGVAKRRKIMGDQYFIAKILILYGIYRDLPY